MFFFRKKHFALILFSLIVSFSFYIAEENIVKKSFDITQVSAIPVSDKVIVVDAGHRSEKMAVLHLVLVLMNQI